MLEDTPIIEVNEEELNTFKIPLDTHFRLIVLINSVKYEYFIRLKSKSEKLLILGSGAYKPSAMSLPVFQRHSWIDDLDDSMIFYNDPTLYLDRLMLGWGFGDRDTHYLEKISEIINIIKDRINIQNENMFFYGSSAGGFMSLILAASIKGATAIVNNPQTIFTNYHEVHINKLLRLFDINKEDMETIYKDRTNVVEYFKHVSNIPKIFYMQNALVEHDVDNHLKPFINQLKDIDENITLNKIKLELYFNYKLGHNPVSKSETIDYIRKAMRN
ncbi:glycosyl transferase family 2 [Saliterribacillus persicus]|uniref:Uncharacterized protein n=1 Tax=Saliterribacillus persicus TaxID=930114 RepID=A0A368YAW5_9BACI|nr:glycosyl transferase family 2 [Saliterribacillus persicus]RCW77400.1 hypothetical protein DFR57_101274 [Saliterribacillus persicus]